MHLVLICALWISNSVAINKYGDTSDKTEVAAFFKTQKDCEAVQKLVQPHVKWSQCIGANYLVGK